MAQVLSYVRMALPEIEALDRKKTIFLMALSPIEVHGPHLPLGTDIFIAEELLQRYTAALQEEFPDYTLVTLPSLYLGSDALPVQGCLLYTSLRLKVSKRRSIRKRSRRERRSSVSYTHLDVYKRQGYNPEILLAGRPYSAAAAPRQ